MKVRTQKGTLNLRGIKRRTAAAGATNYEFADELARVGANPAGKAQNARRIGRNNLGTTAGLRGGYTK